MLPPENAQGAMPLVPRGMADEAGPPLELATVPWIVEPAPGPLPNAFVTCE
jgi:hypothetical protein